MEIISPFSKGSVSYMQIGKSDGINHIRAWRRQQQLGSSLYRILRINILFFASDKRQIQCVTNECTYTFYGKLDEVEQELMNGGFVRIHQRYLVRAGAVEHMDSSEVTLQGGRTLPISRSCQTAAMAALTRALLE